MVSFLFRPGSGVPGDISRVDETIVEPATMDPAVPVLAFGAPVKLTVVSGLSKIQAIEAADAAADFFGVLSRVAPSIAGDTAETFAAGTPNPAAIAGVVKKGYILVVCPVGTPVRNGIVYMRVVEALPKLVGDFEADADGANSVALVGVTWAVDGKDADDVAELSLGR